MMYSKEKIQKFRWPVTVSRIIKAPPQEIWSLISMPGNLEKCHPFCKANPVSKWPGVGSRDTIHYYSGWVMQREFVSWIEGKGYDLYIGRDGGGRSKVTWRIAEAPGGAKLTIRIFPYALQKIPTVIRWIPHHLMLKPALQSYLESVVKGFDWYITTGVPVRKNQFGTHKWFSNETD